MSKQEVAVTLVVGILVLASLFYVYSTNVTVRAVRVFVLYNGAGGYLGSNVDSNYNPFRMVYGATNYTYPGFTIGGIKQETIQLSLTSNSSDSHKVISIQVSTVGFTLISIKPPTSITVPAGDPALLITLLIQCPFLGYEGNLDLQLSVT